MRSRGIACAVAEYMAKDPVCGMSLDEASAPITTTYAATAYHFCSTDCFQKFNANPKKYIDQKIRKMVDA
jgi:Cu+-exporting ATPase